MVKNSEEVSSIQTEIKQTLKRNNISINRFGRICYCNLYETDVEEEIESFVQKFKKHLNRNTTPIELLKTYHKILFKQPEVNKSDIILPQNNSENHFDKNFTKELHEISSSIDLLIKKDEF